MEYGFLSVLPVIVLLVVAIITRRTVSSMVLGLITASIILGGTGFIGVLFDQVYESVGTADALWLICTLILVGAVIGLLGLSGGADALAIVLEKKVKSERSLWIWSWLLIAVVFIQDMARAAILGQLTPLFDKFKVPRAAVTYLADSTGTTLEALIPITGWSLFFMGVFGGYNELKALGDSGFDIYVHCIPYQFYTIAALIICFMFTMGIFPKLGGMKKAYERAKNEGVLYGEETRKINEAIEISNAKSEQNRNASVKVKLGVFIVCVLFMVASVIKSGDVVVGFFSTLILATILLLATRLAKWGEIMTAAINGVTGILDVILIAAIVYTFKDLITELDLAGYVIHLTNGILTPEIFPFITFVLCCVLTFCSGSTWGITVIYAAIAIPLATSLGANPALVVGAILSGECFGAHICFYCDYTVCYSALTKINNMEHALTQLPYGLIGGAIAAIGYLICGFVM